MHNRETVREAQLDLRWTIAPPKSVYVSRKDDVAKLDEFVGPKR